MPALITALQGLSVDPRDGELHSIFFNEPQKTKLEQFFRLLFYIQKGFPERLPVVVGPPAITDVLLAARVFPEPSFPDRIRAVLLERGKSPRYTVRFADREVRFPLNGGVGFAVWDHGRCQTALELVFHDGFSFSLSLSGRNLVVSDFEGVELYGDFGNRGLIDVDLNYVDLERVEFIAGTDQGKVKSRVSQREFAANSHSFLFKFVGRLIPDTSQQRIDW